MSSEFSVGWARLTPGDFSDVEPFAKTYTVAGFSRLRFAWNGKHSDGFEDSNYEFRNQVREYALAHPQAVPAVLLRDIFTADMEWAKEAWCVSDDAHELANQMMKAGGPAFIREYLVGHFKSFDTALGTSLGDAEPGLLRACLAEMERRLQTNPSSADRALFENGRERFLEWLAKL
jgi:hypothetical protein